MDWVGLVLFEVSVFLNLEVRSRRNFLRGACYISFIPTLFLKRGGRGQKAEKEKKSVADPCNSETANKITSKESLVVSHNMVKLEIAGNQPN